MGDKYEIDQSEIVEPGPAVLELGEPVDLDSVEVPGLEPGPGPEELEAFQALAAESIGSAAVRVAMGQRGVAESGGQNCGVPHERYVKYFGQNLPPSAWCAYFVSWCFAQAGWKPQWRNPGAVASIREWASANGHMVSQPQHGDLFGLGNEHIGFVAGANPQTRQIWTVEGNWSDRCGSRLVNYANAGLWFARI